MANRKTNYKPDYYSSMCGNHETFGTIYKSMLVSEKFKELSLSARFIYCLCRCQLTSNNGRQTLYNHGKENNIDYPANCFVFPAKHIKEYGLDRSNVSKHLTELEKAGFIKRYEKNGHRWKVNVYQFSAEWKNNKT